MLQEILGWTYGILAIAFFVYTVIWNIWRLYYAVKCRNTRQCRRTDCCFSSYCDKYEEVPTEEEIQLLYDFIEELKRQKRTA